MFSLFLLIYLMKSLSYKMHYFLHFNYSITLLKHPEWTNFSEISIKSRFLKKSSSLPLLYNSSTNNTTNFVRLEILTVML